MANFVLSNPLEILGGISGNVLANVGGGYALLNEQATAINPTIAPNKLILGTGISAVDNEGAGTFHIITDDIPVMNFSLANIVATVTNSFEVNGAFFVDGNSDTIQMRVDAHSTQTSLLLRIRNTSAATIFAVDNSGDLTLSGGVFTGPAPPATGGLGVSNQRWIVWRNNGNNSDIETLRVDFNDATVLNTAPGENLLLQIGNTTQLDISTNLAVFTGTVRGVLSGAYALLNEASTETNPTLIPNRGNLATGVGGLGGNLTLVVGGTTRMEIDGNGIGFFNKTPVIRPAGYLLTNVSVVRSFDANSVIIADLADVVGTLINDLIDYGLLQVGGA